jgi:hypothetical protein
MKKKTIQSTSQSIFTKNSFNILKPFHHSNFTTKRKRGQAFA